MLEEIKSAANKWAAETGNHHDAISFERGAMFALKSQPVKPSLQSVEEAAKAHANKNSYQSDKHQFTITPWIQHNWAISDFKAGAEWQAHQVKPDVDDINNKSDANEIDEFKEWWAGFLASQINPVVVYAHFEKYFKPKWQIEKL